jgi:tRNA A-37 threonylcarbamoyl transferase component Bud32
MKLGLPTGAEAGKAAVSGDQGDVPTMTTPPAGFEPPSPAELAGQFPQLEIVELLGQGGMGAVYKARQKQLDRLVALKILPPQIGQTEAFAERFTREARSLARLNHPRIVSVHDFGHTDAGLYYFIMEFVDGTDLRRVIQSGELSPAEALAIVPQICEALQYAHEQGIVHRDIKPENILLDTKGQARIADFGLAKLLDQPAAAYTLTRAGQKMGTPHYMAPEQIEHPNAVDHRADIFSLGVVFYEMLTGELPLGRFPAPSQKVQVDVRLDKVVLRTLEKEPERRYQHASEVKTDVEAISAGDEPPLLRETPSEGEEAVSRRLRIPAIGLMVSGVVNIPAFVLVSTAAFTVEWVDTPGEPGLLVVAVVTATILIGAVIMLGGWQMLRLRSYSWAVAGSVLALLPLSVGFMLGFPMGIWALFVLNRPDVQQAFTSRKKEQRGKAKYRPGMLFGIKIEDHLKIIAYIRIGIGSMFLVVALVIFLVFVIPVIEPGNRDDLPILLAFGGTFALLPLAAAVWDLAGGIGLLKRKRWARILVLIGAVPELFLFLPVGTAMGIYTIWVLMQKETIQLFVRVSAGQKKEQGTQAKKRRGNLVLAVVLIVAVFLSACAFTLSSMIFGWPVNVRSALIRQSPQISAESISSSEQLSQLDLPYGTPEDLTFGTEGPALSEKCIQTLELEASEAAQVHKILRRAYGQYFGLERQNTQQNRAANNLTVTISPFREEAERFLEQLWADLDSILDEQKRILAHRHLPLGQMFGTFQFGGPEVTITVTEAGGTFIYSTVYKWPKGKSSIGGKGSVDMTGSGRALPPEYSRFWEETATDK